MHPRGVNVLKCANRGVTVLLPVLLNQGNKKNLCCREAEVDTFTPMSLFWLFWYLFFVINMPRYLNSSVFLFVFYWFYCITIIFYLAALIFVQLKRYYFILFNYYSGVFFLLSKYVYMCTKSGFLLMSYLWQNEGR